jgi:hypothetical protein
MIAPLHMQAGAHRLSATDAYGKASVGDTSVKHETLQILRQRTSLSRAPGRSISVCTHLAVCPTGKARRNLDWTPRKSVLDEADQKGRDELRAAGLIALLIA